MGKRDRGKEGESEREGERSYLLKVRGRLGMVELPPVVRETCFAGDCLEARSVILNLKQHTRPH